MLCNFTSVFEFLGGLAIAFAGFKDFRVLFVRYVHQLNPSLKDEIAGIIRDANRTESAVKEFKSNVQGNEFVSSAVKNALENERRKQRKIKRFFSQNSFKEQEHEIFIMKSIFIKGCVLSTLFAFTFLILAGVENIQSSSFSNFLAFYFTILFSLICIVSLIYPFLNLNSRIRQLTCGKYNDGESDNGVIWSVVLIWFLVFLLVALAISLVIFFCNGGYVFSYPFWILIPLSFLTSFLSVASLFYRYWYYLRIKKFIIVRKIRSYNRALKIAKSNLREF